MRFEAPTPPEALARIRAPLAATGAVLVDPPVIQPLNVMLDLAGEAMRARLFVVQDEGGREACLRPDFTVAVAREHMASGAQRGRYRYEGRAFRVAPAGIGGDHPEEFQQLGLEVFGEPATPEADALIAAAAWQAASAGGRKDLQIRFGDVGLFSAFLEGLGVRPGVRERLKHALGRPRRLEALLSRAGPALSDEAAEIAGLSVKAATARIEAVWDERGLDPIGGRTAAEIAERLTAQARAAKEPRLTGGQLAAINAYLALTGPLDQVLDEVESLGAALRLAVLQWRERINRIEGAGVDLSAATLTTGFSRVFGYYDGVLFEIVSAALGPDIPVSAGGRYDGLTAQIGGAPATAVGCMVRPARAIA